VRGDWANVRVADTAPSMKWEYAFVHSKTNMSALTDARSELTQLGDQGWELVSVVPGSTNERGAVDLLYYCLKRAKI